MVEQNEHLDAVLKAIADPVRRQILAALKSGPATVGEIAEPHDMTFAGAAKHLNVLVGANLVEKRRVGRQQVCSLNAKPMRTIQTWLETYTEFWESRLDDLDNAVREYEGKE